MKKIFLILFIFLFNCGFKSNILYNVKDSFGYINLYFQIKPILSILDNSGYYGQNIVLINDLLKKFILIKASSHIIKHKDDTTILITSNHVCDDLFNKSEFSSQLQVIKENLIISNLITQSTLNLFEFEIIHEIKDFYGKSYQIISKNKKDINNDLCEIRTSYKWGKSLNITNHECEWGDEIFNVSVSAGYYFENAVPIRTGYFLGKVKNELNDNTINSYSLNIQQGASGSLVFNKKGNICGNINLASKNADISFGATNKALNEFIKDI